MLQPSEIKRRPESVGRSVGFQGRKKMVERFAILPDDPVPVFTHDSQSMQHDSLPRTNDGPQFAIAIEGFGEFEVDAHFSKKKSPLRGRKER